MQYLVLLAIAIFVATATAAVPPLGARPRYPLYKQCNASWGNATMGVVGPGERNSICNEGCAMSCVAMALAGLGATVGGGHAVTPGTFNTWLIANDGYLCLDGDCNNLNLTAPERLSPVLPLIGEHAKPSFNQIASDLDDGSVVHVAHVRNRSHFVLLTAPTADGFAFHVRDPGFDRDTYTYVEVSDIIRYKINRYPVYKQCNASWGKTAMGGDGATICQVGCLMSSIASGLAGTSIAVARHLATPATVNAFLQTHHGFVPHTSDLMESMIPSIAPRRVVWDATTGFYRNNTAVPWATVQTFLDQPVPRVVIANVMHGQHFVLVVGYRDDGDTLVVNDSGFDRNTYSYAKDVVGWRIFDMR
jgi:hypothetical protein